MQIASGMPATTFSEAAFAFEAATLACGDGGDSDWLDDLSDLCDSVEANAMDLKTLPNTEFVQPRPLASVLDVLQPGPEHAVGLVSSKDWFTYDAPDHAHFDAYDAAFDALAKQIDALVGETAKRTLGFDEETFEPIPFLADLDVYCDAFYHWKKAGLLLITVHEDKELPIDISVMRVTRNR
ncbi:MAG: hypothetical protein AAFP04_14400 [Myxococcota bacterium]